jgi:hypothetical protein
MSTVATILSSIGRTFRILDPSWARPRAFPQARRLRLDRRNLILTEASGLGKSWLACALGHKACREKLLEGPSKRERLDAAKAAAPYCHTRLFSTELSGPEKWPIQTLEVPPDISAFGMRIAIGAIGAKVRIG